MLQTFERQLIEQLKLSRWLQATLEEKKSILLDVFRFFCDFFGLKNQLRFTMPSGFETANGLSDPVSGDICLNAELWSEGSCEPMFTLLHELRHSIQAARAELFGAEFALNNTHVIQFDGTGYLVQDGTIRVVKLHGEQAYYTELYLASPCERDANAFAHRCLKAAGAGAEIDELFAFWSPRWTHFSQEDATGEFLKAAALIDRLAAKEEDA